MPLSNTASPQSERKEGSLVSFETVETLKRYFYMGSGIGPMPMHDVVVMAVRGSPIPVSSVASEGRALLCGAGATFSGSSKDPSRPLKGRLLKRTAAHAACSCDGGQGGRYGGHYDF